MVAALVLGIREIGVDDRLPDRSLVGPADRSTYEELRKATSDLTSKRRMSSLCRDLSRLRPRASDRPSHPRAHPQHHHAVLADAHRRLVGPVVLEERASGGSRGPPTA